MSSSRKRARSGTSKEERGNNDGISVSASISTSDSSAPPALEQEEGTENDTNSQSPSLASNQNQDSPQSFFTQEERAADHSEEASKRALYFQSANDPQSEDEDDDHHDLNDDSDESSYASDASSSGDEGENMNGLTLMEKRQRNEERNALRHQQLFGEYNAAMGKSQENVKDSKPSEKYESDNDENDSKPRSRGMLMKRKSELLPEPKSFRQKVKDLDDLYPHREHQIRQLLSLFQSTIAQGQLNSRGRSSGFVPSPLFVIGSNGTGKTSVVRETLQLARDEESIPPSSTNIQALRQSEVAYINCATLEPASIGRLTLSISNQLRPKSSNVSSKRKKRKRKRDQNRGMGIVAAAAASSRMEENGEGSSAPSRQHEQPQHDAADASNGIAKTPDKLRRVQPTRAAKVMDIDDLSKQTRRKSNSKDPENEEDEQTTDRMESANSAVVALGRNLQRYYGSRSKRCGFVILDQNPERLLTMSSSDGRNEKSNVLAELLLLPRVMQLNICFVVVTTNRLLPSSRLNNLAGPTKASATLLTALRPLCIQFPAYKGKECFMKILKSERARDTIIGSYNKSLSCRREFFSKLIDSFLTSLIQFLSESTRDINDYLRVGRSLWPVFIRPIDPKNIQGTMQAISAKSPVPSNTTDSAIETRILAHLGQKLLRFTSTMSSDDPTSIMLDLSNHKKPCQQSELKLPFLQLCLLLAAFICQTNRTDQDKKFFSSEGNGKRRKNNRAQQGENVAYSASATEVKQLQSLRPKPFQLERVLSIFATLVRLNPRDAGVFADMDEERLQSLGSARLDMDLQQLVDLGFLHPASSGGAAGKHHASENLDRARFWCSLTRVEADRIAKRAKIPLDKYML